MSIIISRRVTPLKFHHFGHQWLYGVKNNCVATCPHCRAYVTIKKSLNLKSDKYFTSEQISDNDPFTDWRS